MYFSFCGTEQKKQVHRAWSINSGGFLNIPSYQIRTEGSVWVHVSAITLNFICHLAKEEKKIAKLQLRKW